MNPLQAITLKARSCCIAIFKQKTSIRNDSLSLMFTISLNKCVSPVSPLNRGDINIPSPEQNGNDFLTMITLKMRQIVSTKPLFLFAVIGRSTNIGSAIWLEPRDKPGSMK